MQTLYMLYESRDQQEQERKINIQREFFHTWGNGQISLGHKKTF